MNIKRHIPNLLTLGNLFFGTLAVIFAVKEDFELTALFVVIGISFDFLDGFVARLLNVQGELGKQLDSLADMVTSGVVPGIVMLQMLANSIDKDVVGYFGFNSEETIGSNLAYIGLILTLAACYRLAKFNLDTRQSDSFIGLPTPAMCLFVISLPLISEYSEYPFFIELVQNNYFLIVVTLVFSYLMNAELPLFSLKFKDYSLKKNVVKYVFLILSVFLIVILKYVALPLVIIMYILLSIIFNYGKKETT